MIASNQSPYIKLHIDSKFIYNFEMYPKKYLLYKQIRHLQYFQLRVSKLHKFQMITQILNPKFLNLTLNHNGQCLSKGGL